MESIKDRAERIEESFYESSLYFQDVLNGIDNLSMDQLKKVGCETHYEASMHIIMEGTASSQTAVDIVSMGCMEVALNEQACELDDDGKEAA